MTIGIIVCYNLLLLLFTNNYFIIHVNDKRFKLIVQRIIIIDNCNISE